MWGGSATCSLRCGGLALNDTLELNLAGVKTIVFALVVGIVVIDEAVTLFGYGIPYWNKNVANYPKEEDSDGGASHR
ncbi:MAG: hypothetical protein R3C56_02690 [Pirellulaceae bacterium]